MQKSFRSVPGGQNTFIAIGIVFLILLAVVFFVLHKSTSKPQSPQAMVAVAVSEWFAPTPREWKPGMGPQPLMYHPAAQQQLVWEPLPTAPKAQQPKFETGWRALPGQQATAPNAPGAPGAQGNGIRAYTGPVQ